MQMRNFLLQFVLGQAPKSAKMTGLIAKVYAVPIPLQFRLKVMRIRGASIGITKKVSSTESEKYHNVLHVHDRDQMYKYVDIGII